MILKLVRLSEFKETTLGVLLLDDQPFWKTVELPWRDNSPMISCIPEGEYKAHKHLSPKFGRTLHIESVPGRTEILMHPGNTTDDSRGCILPGLTFGSLNGLPAVFESRKAMERILDSIRSVEEITIKIVKAP